MFKGCRYKVRTPREYGDHNSGIAECDRIFLLYALCLADMHFGATEFLAYRCVPGLTVVLERYCLNPLIIGRRCGLADLCQLRISLIGVIWRLREWHKKFAVALHLYPCENAEM